MASASATCAQCVVVAGDAESRLTAAVTGAQKLDAVRRPLRR